MPRLSEQGDLQRGRSLPRAVLTLVVVAAALAAALALFGFGVVGGHGGGVAQGWDDTVGQWFLHERTGLVGISRVIAWVGDAPVLGIITAIIALAMWTAGQRTRAFIPVTAYLGAEFLVYLTRSFVHRPRPTTAHFPSAGALPGIHETSYSFPSGHATAGVAVLCSLAGLVALTWHVWWPWAVVAVPALAVALSRLVLGVHWFSDVTVGLVVGATWGVTVVFVLAHAPWPFRGQHRKPIGSRPSSIRG
jgi:membrane-associated phospholipid phosphatase